MKTTNPPLFALFVILLLPACAVQSGPGKSKYFNSEKFIGLEAISNDYKQVKLDYQLDGADGEVIMFQSCEDVENAESSGVVTSQFDLYRLLTVNCMAARKIADGTVPAMGYLPEELSPEFLRSIPATAVPNQGGDVQAGRFDTPMGQYEKELTILGSTENSISVKLTDGMEVDYILLGRADVNKDGIEDFVMRLDWAVPESFGRGTDLVVLTRLGEAAPVTLISRYPK